MDYFKKESLKYYGWDTFASSRKADKRGKHGNPGKKCIRAKLKEKARKEFWDGFEEFIEERRNLEKEKSISESDELRENGSDY